MVADSGVKGHAELMAEARREINAAYGDERQSLTVDLDIVEEFLAEALTGQQEEREWKIALALQFLVRTRQFHGANSD